MDPQDDGLDSLGMDARLMRDVRTDPQALEQEVSRISAITAYWGETYAKATEAYLLAEMERKNAEARAMLTAKTTLTDLGTKATVDEVKSRASVDPMYQGARRAEIDAEVALVRSKNTMDALRAKRDSLFALAQIRVQEMKGDPLLREQGGQRSTGSPDFARAPTRGG